MAFWFPWFSNKRKSNKAKESITTTTTTILQPQPPEPDPVLFDILHWSPWNEEERRQFDNEALRRRIQEYPDCVRAKYEFKAAGRGNLKRYPFHRAVALGATVEVLQVMHQTFPNAMQELGTFSNTPLHAACAYGAEPDVIDFLLREYPEAASIRNKHGYFPLHNICEYGVLPTPKVIKLLINANPEALGKRNKLGQTPYSTVQRRRRRQRQGESDINPEILRILSEQTKEIIATTEEEDPDLESMTFEVGG